MDVEDKREIPESVRNEALAQGWTDKEHWKGPEGDWVDADVFVQRGKEWVGNLRKSNDNLQRELANTKEQLKEIRATTEEFKRFQKEAYEKKIQDYETKLTELKEVRARAISDGDGSKVNELDDAIDNIKDEVRETKAVATKAQEESYKPAATTQLDPALQSWLDNNKWFGTDRRMTAITNGIGESLRLEQPLLKGQEFLDKLDEILLEEFPDRLGKPNTGRGSPVESGSGSRQSRTRGNPHSYDNLPADAKKACDKFVQQKLMSREEYLSMYDWS